MKGIIFNLLEHVVSRDMGEEAWDSLLASAGVTGVYTAVGSYPHEELLALVAAATTATGKSADELIRWFGREALPLLYQRYPGFFDPHPGTRPFLLTLNDVIHPEVRKLFPGAFAPSFDVDETDPGAVALSYQSHRGLCAFAEGLVEGTAAHYGEVAVVDQPSCTKRGDPRCMLRVRLAPR